MASIYFVCHFYVAVSEVGYLVVSAAGNEDCGTTDSRCITVRVSWKSRWLCNSFFSFNVNSSFHTMFYFQIKNYFHIPLYQLYNIHNAVVYSQKQLFFTEHYIDCITYTIFICNSISLTLSFTLAHIPNKKGKIHTN